MNNNKINAIMGIILASNPEDAVNRLMEGGYGFIVNYLKDYSLLKSCMEEYLQSIQNEITRSQLEELIPIVEKQVFDKVKEKNKNVIIDLERDLESEFSKVDILPEMRTNLKNTFICYIMTYIHKVDLDFFNILTMQFEIEKQRNENDEQRQRIQKIETLVTNLQVLLREFTSKQFSEMPIIRGRASLNINESTRVVERAEEFEQIDKIFQMGSHVAFLYGRPGIGKTTLARLYANYSHANQIYFVKYEQSIEYTVSKLSSKPEKYTGKDILKYWRGLNVEECNSILLIIDNFNEDSLQGSDKKNFMKELAGKFYKELLEIGIRIIFTTRIYVGNNVFEVPPVGDTFELFRRYCGTDTITSEEEILIKKIIRVVFSNTLLIILSAQIWRRSNTNEREGLLKAISNGKLKENTKLIPVNPEIETVENEMTTYNQVVALLDFSGILNDDSLKRIFVNAALLPLQGLSKFIFLDVVNCENDNELNSLINGCWILCEDSTIMMHPIIREIAFTKKMVSYSLCHEYCENISVNLDIEKPLKNRIVYKEYAYEIFEKFRDIEEMDIVLVRLFYGLSDIYDNISEKEISMEIADVVSRNMITMESFPLERARMLSGIAYSINNCFNSMADLEKADKLLESAKNIVEKLGITNNERVRYAHTYGKILSNYGSNCISKGKFDSSQANDYFAKALEWHRSALEFRQNQLYRLYIDVNVRKKMKAEVATSYTNIATTYFWLKQYKKAIEYHLKAYEVRKELGNENAQSVNSQRIIGCVLEIYKCNLDVESKYLNNALDYYPDLLMINYTFKNIRSLKENLDYFFAIATIIQYDRRFSMLQDKLNEKTQKIIDWLKNEVELRENIKEQIEKICRIVFEQTK